MTPEEWEQEKKGHDERDTTAMAKLSHLALRWGSKVVVGYEKLLPPAIVVVHGLGGVETWRLTQEVKPSKDSWYALVKTQKT